MTDIALRDDNAPAPYESDPTGGRLVAWAQAAHAAHQLASALCKTAFAPKHFRDNPGDSTAAIMAGDELGLSPLASLRSIYVIHGTPSMYAKTMVALVQSRGHEVWTESTSDAAVVVCGRRRGSDKVERAEWKIERARKAGYTSNQKYASNPQEMLYAKAASEVCKKIASDVLLGIPAAEDVELEEQATVTVTRAESKPRTVTRRKAPEPLEPEFSEPPVDDEPALLAEELITPAQMKKLHASFSDKGFVDRDDRLAYVNEIVGIEVASSKDLTKDQASRVIDALEQLADVEQS